MEDWTPNMVVAHNLRRARGSLTQEEAARLLEPYLGERWSKATFSTVENSVKGKRIRQFTADDLIAFGLAFDRPISFFLEPPQGVTVRVGEEIADVGPLLSGSESYSLRELERALTESAQIVQSMRQKAEPSESGAASITRDLEQMEFVSPVPGVRSGDLKKHEDVKDFDRIETTPEEERTRALIRDLDQADSTFIASKVRNQIALNLCVRYDRWMTEAEVDQQIQEIRESMEDEERGTA